MSEQTGMCPDCGHSLEGNNHGFDQNDGFLDENNKLVHFGRCTYCKICNPTEGDDKDAQD